ncbi:MAG: response regulator [Anaerolineae bacterium]|nr:response regulator [Anaerolineae bacterium]
MTSPSPSPSTSPPESAAWQRLFTLLVRWRGVVALLVGLAALFLGCGDAIFARAWSQITAGHLLLAVAAGGTVYAILALAHRRERVLHDLLAQLRSERDKTTTLIEALTEERDTVSDLNAQLSAMNRALNELSVAKSEFMARMSHELRTPLNSIVGYSELVLDGVYGELSEQQRDRLQRILRNGRNLLGLINDILDLSRIDAGHLSLSYSTVPVSEAVRLAVASIEPQAQVKGLPILISFEGHLPDIRADELRLRHIIIHLLDNAIKFTEHGRIGVWAGHVHIRSLEDTRYPQLGHGDWLVVRVSDTGMGVDPALHGAIFEDFTQADSSATRAHEGGGLGLAITRRLVELHGGRIWVDSVPGEGATFSFAIPYTNAIQYTAEAPAAEPAAAREQPMVLAVDDEDEALEIIDAYLSKGGFTVARARGGAEALQLAAQLRPDIITLDILMPDLDGWQVLDRLRANPITADIPVVMVSIVDQKPRALELGAVDHIAKPVDRDALLSAVTEAIAARPRLPILVVGENPNDRNIFAAVLRMAGHQVASVEDEDAAIAWLQARRAGLVLMDLKRERVEDLKVLGFMRRHQPTAETPAVVVWAADMPSQDAARALRTQRTWVLKKHGLAQETLVESVARAMRHHNGRGSGRQVKEDGGS